MKILQFLAMAIVSQISIAGTPPTQAPITETAVVEKIFKTTDDGFTCIFYLITWHGQPTIVDDPIHSTDFKVGDKLGFLVMKHDMSTRKKGQKILHLTVMPFVPAPTPTD